MAKYPTTKEIKAKQRKERLRDAGEGKTNPVTVADVKARHQTGSGRGGRTIASILFGK